MELFIFLGSLFTLLFTGMPIAIVLFICCLILIMVLRYGRSSISALFPSSERNW